MGYWVKERYVLDTNALIYASETWEEGYRKAHEWTRRRSPLLMLSRRRYGEAVVRHILDMCADGVAECIIPQRVYDEILKTKEPDLRERALKLIKDANIRVVNFTLEPEDILDLVSEEMKDDVARYLRECEIRGKSIGVDMCADPYVLVLAYREGGKIVTADRSLAELANDIGITTIYPVSKQIRIQESVFKPRMPTRTRRTIYARV